MTSEQGTKPPVIHPRILIANHELAVQHLLIEALHREDYDIQAVSLGRDALEFAVTKRPDLILLDFHLQDLKGVELCRLIRQHPAVHGMAILMSSGSRLKGHPAICLNSGADAYIDNPLDIQDLLAHIRAILRRPSVYQEDPHVIEKGCIMIRVMEQRVLVEGRVVENLTPKEFALMKQLILHAPNVVPRQLLAEKVWGSSLEELDRRTLDVHIQRLRQKVGPKASTFLKTLATVGYRWTEDNSLAKKA